MTSYNPNLGETSYSKKMRVRIKPTPEDVDIGSYKMEEQPEKPRVRD